MINALKYTQKLIESSFTNRQADEVINVLREIMEQNLATKNDLLNLERRLTSDIKDVCTEMNQLHNEIRITAERTEYRMTIKLGAMLAVGIGALATLLKFL